MLYSPVVHSLLVTDNWFYIESTDMTRGNQIKFLDINQRLVSIKINLLKMIDI